MVVSGSVWFCMYTACLQKIPWHAFQVPESHNLSLEFGRHLKKKKTTAFSVYERTSGHENTSYSSYRERAGMLAHGSEPVNSIPFNFSFYEKNMTINTIYLVCFILLVHESILSI